MNLVLRTETALLAAASMTLERTGATEQSEAIDNAATSAGTFNAGAHPRGADGKFITTGGTVQVLGGQDGKTPIIEGTATVVQTNQGPMIQVKSPSTGQVTTVSPSEIQAAPASIATLGATGTQGIPVAPGAAARAGAADARTGVPPRSGKDALSQQANPALMAAYLAAYKTEQAKVQKAAAAKVVAAEKKKAAAVKKAAAASAPPKPVSTKSARRYYK